MRLVWAAINGQSRSNFFQLTVRGNSFGYFRNRNIYNSTITHNILISVCECKRCLHCTFLNNFNLRTINIMCYKTTLLTNDIFDKWNSCVFSSNEHLCRANICNYIVPLNDMDYRMNTFKFRKLSKMCVRKKKCFNTIK